MTPKEFELTLISLLTAARSEDDSVLESYIDSIDLKEFVVTWAKNLVASWDMANQDMIVELSGMVDEDLGTVLQEAALYVAGASEDDFGLN